jgi:hypothetical protein
VTVSEKFLGRPDKLGENPARKADQKQSQYGKG